MSERTELRRMEGFRDRLQACGVPLATVLEAGHYRRDAGMAALLGYLDATPRDQRLQALFCENDILAIGAIDALVARHLPNRIAIVGFDDIEMASSPSYALTTFRQPIELLVKEAIARIVEPDSERPRSFMAPGGLVVRQSHRRQG